ncbi:MAG TPA: OsmC family protein [Cyclobacteriaceae bacterium]|nr:OsmC family protein [Cyclobacteriaceae bacterium]
MVTATIGRDAYRTELLTNGHHLIADEPEEVGGKNLGPGPGEFLMVSLASCTAITVRMYADRKRWPLEKIRVEVSSERMEQMTLFMRHVYLEGALDDTQRARLLQIANACPVHKTLTNPIEIKTELR